MMWYYSDNNHWGWGAWLMMSSMILFWIVLVAGGILAARYLTGPRATDPTHHSEAESILAGRFARGEIDEDEYRRSLTVLREHHTQDI